MPDRFTDRSPDRPSEDELREHAAFAARRSAPSLTMHSQKMLAVGVARAIEAFAATLPESGRLYALLNANPLM